LILESIFNLNLLIKLYNQLILFKVKLILIYERENTY